MKAPTLVTLVLSLASLTAANGTAADAPRPMVGGGSMGGGPVPPQGSGHAPLVFRGGDPGIPFLDLQGS